MVKRELKTLEQIARKIVGKETLKKIKKVKEPEEKLQVLKYAIGFHLEIRLDEIEQKIKKLEKEKDLFVAKTKLSLLKTKIKLFEATFHKKDFNTLQNLLKEIEKEL
jgi:aminopeptidase-like protein